MSHWIVSAHRGYVLPGMRENTLSAFRLAAERGAEMIETDARATSDGVLVANHDPVAVGFDENGNRKELVIAQTDWNTLSGLILAPDDPNGVQRLPRLRDILLLAHDTGLRVNIDLKNGIANVREVAETVLECRPAGRTVYATNGAGAEAIRTILAVDPDALFIDQPKYYTRGLLSSVRDYQERCFAYTADFSIENITRIRKSGCMLAAISLTEQTAGNAFIWNPDMAEYPHTSDFVTIEQAWREGKL